MDPRFARTAGYNPAAFHYERSSLGVGVLELGWIKLTFSLPYLESGIWNLEPGIWNLESGIWNLRFACYCIQRIVITNLFSFSRLLKKKLMLYLNGYYKCAVNDCHSQSGFWPHVPTSHIEQGSTVGCKRAKIKLFAPWLCSRTLVTDCWLRCPSIYRLLRTM